jgi:hypothetical protein
MKTKPEPKVARQRKRRSPIRRSLSRQRTAFLNVPYDRRYEPLYLAFIAGLCGFGLIPRATIEIPGSERRLDRIIGLIRSCRYSSMTFPELKSTVRQLLRRHASICHLSLGLRLLGRRISELRIIGLSSKPHLTVSANLSATSTAPIRTFTVVRRAEFCAHSQMHSRGHAIHPLLRNSNCFTVSSEKPPTNCAEISRAGLCSRPGRSAI